MLRPTALLPWSRPRHELLLLALVAVAAAVLGLRQLDAGPLALLPVASDGRGPADDRLVRRQHLDRSIYGGHYYSNKAPGMSLLAIPAVEAVRLPTGSKWNAEADLHLWGVRVLTSGLAFLLCVFLVGRISEGLAAGSGAPHSSRSGSAR